MLSMRVGETSPQSVGARHWSSPALNTRIGPRPCGDRALFHGLYRWIDLCNTGSVAGFTPFRIGSNTVGYVPPEVADLLASRCAAHAKRLQTNCIVLVKEHLTTGIQLLSVQGVLPAFTLSNEEISLSPHLSTASLEERTDAVSHTLARLRDEGVIDGWRNELYPVADRFVLLAAHSQVMWHILC
jgi:hypothetical protein